MNSWVLVNTALLFLLVHISPFILLRLAADTGTPPLLPDHAPVALQRVTPSFCTGDFRKQSFA